MGCCVRYRSGKSLSLLTLAWAFDRNLFLEGNAKEGSCGAIRETVDHLLRDGNWPVEINVGAKDLIDDAAKGQVATPATTIIARR